MIEARGALAILSSAARGESLPAFGERCIPPGLLRSRARIFPIFGPFGSSPAGRLARLGAAALFRHGLLALILAGSGIAHAQPQSQGPAAWWSFDDDPGEAAARDRAGSISDTIEGRTTRVAGVVGRAIRLDGFTSLIRRSNAAAPKITGAFTVESWVALAAYPLELGSDHRP